jgi:hypothetical protein
MEHKLFYSDSEGGVHGPYISFQDPQKDEEFVVVSLLPDNYLTIIPAHLLNPKPKLRRMRRG